MVPESKHDSINPVLRVENIVKNFDAVRALDQVALDVFPGDLVGLVGDNGAGKSTLVKVVAGVHQADQGRICIDGKEVSMRTPQHARELGIETVYQDLALVNQLRVDGNLFLGREPLKKGFFGTFFGILDQRMMREKTREAMEQLHIIIPGLSSEPVHRMSGGQRQAAAIARSVFWGSKLLLLDEPTAALGVAQREEVEKLIMRMKEKGIPAIIISHNLEHVFEVCDRIVVLRQGKKVKDCPKTDTTPEEIVGCITGAVAHTA